jgi:hypothetical protein
MTIDEILAGLPDLTFEELQVVIDRINELKLDTAQPISTHLPSEEKNAKVEALLTKARAFRDSLNLTTTPEEIDRFKREGRL